MAKKEVKVEPQEVAVIATRKELVLEGDPESQLEYAAKAAKALMGVVESKPRKVIINGKQYLEYGSWQTLARFFGATAGIEWSRPINDSKGVLLGYEARAIVNQRGVIISSAEAVCMKSERRWKTADEYAIKSMAQTRAAAKALRNAFGWVAEMAGYQSTPAEEMDSVGGYDTSPIADTAPVVVSGADEIEEARPPTIAALKSTIRTIADTNAASPLRVRSDYVEWVHMMVNLDLADQSRENLTAIVDALKIKFDLAEPN